MKTPRRIADLPFVAAPGDYDTQEGPFLAETYVQHGPIFRSTAYGPNG